MPKTFQDAVIVTRRLGLRYLWIDSLCIMQDNSEDWEQQSALMGSIFYQSTVTIMAITTPSGHQTREGFLQARQPSHSADVHMQYETGNDKPVAEWAIRALEYQETLSWDLLSRGWVLQERVLSRRKIIYTPAYTQWASSSHLRECSASNSYQDL
jgi:hypothetical protein